MAYRQLNLGLNLDSLGPELLQTQLYYLHEAWIPNQLNQNLFSLVNTEGDHLISNE